MTSERKRHAMQLLTWTLMLLTASFFVANLALGSVASHTIRATLVICGALTLSAAQATAIIADSLDPPP